MLQMQSRICFIRLLFVGRCKTSSSSVMSILIHIYVSEIDIVDLQLNLSFRPHGKRPPF